jgi:putative flavoprotein involved in K+ transport
VVESCDVVIVGAGQAGLSLSNELSRSNREHIVLERGTVGQSWRNRWDGFCLVLPNWTVHLSGQPYAGADPDGFMARDEIVDYLSDYATSFRSPIRENVSVESLDREDDGCFRLRTSTGDIRAREVVLATGGYQKPYRPAGVRELPSSLQVIDAPGYSNPGALPPGKVLVIGSGQTGCQIAEEIHQAGREVVLACGRAPWQPRRVGDHDVIFWFIGTPFMDMTLADLPSPMARLGANPQTTGRDGGHDLHYRTLQAMGVTLTGHLVGSEDGQAHFASDLADSVAFGDARYNDIRDLVRRSAADKGLPAPEMPPAPSFVADAPGSVDLADFGAAIFTTGFRPDYASWVRLPEAFDGMGFPIQRDGSSTVIPGLHFMGVHFQRKRSSATLFGVGEDAGVLGKHMAAQPRLA